MALSLVEGMSEAWNPDEYHDTYHDDVMALIEERIRSGRTEAISEPEEETPAPETGGDVVDFMALLKKSIAAKKQAVDEPEKPAPEAAKPADKADKASKPKTSKTRRRA